MKFHARSDSVFLHRNRLLRIGATADGVIVGSAIVKLCGQYGRDCVPYVTEYVKKMVEALA